MNLHQKVQRHDIDNWIKETKSIRYQNIWDLFKRQNLQEGDEIWSYSTKNEQGYAVVRNGKPISSFKTS